MSEYIQQDKRFAQITKDPRFLRLPKNEQKVKIDKRFHGMFKDERFKVKYSMDKRGRPMNKTSSDDLKKFYDISDEEEGSELKDGEESGDDVEGETDEDMSEDVKEDDNDSDGGESERDDGEDEMDKSLVEKQAKMSGGKARGINLKLGEGPDLARGEGNISSDTDSESDDEISDIEGDIDHEWDELDDNVTPVTTTTRRLAICGMDWDRIKADDLFFVFESFKPPTGFIHSVHIYPSEYGLQRLKEEEVSGPSELKLDEETGGGDKEGERYNVEKLRAYQMKRLQYYYAVIECDSAQTANTLYEECDGREFEASCSRLDLRFIPDDMTFEQEPTSVCTQPPDADTYTSNRFITKALGQSKVELTWDETDQSRYKLLTRKLTKDEVEDLDFKAYLASSSDEGVASDADTPRAAEDEGYSDTQEGAATEESRVLKYRQLINAINEEEEKKLESEVSMEVTWEPGMLEKTEEFVKQKLSSADTPWEQYLEDRQQKRREKMRHRGEKHAAGGGGGAGVVETESTKHPKDNGTKFKGMKVKDAKVKDVELSGKDIAGGKDMAGEVAFSDDDVPQDGAYTTLNDERLEATHVSKSKKKKKRKILSQDEEKQIQQEKEELSLLMDEDQQDGKAHYNLSDLVDAASGKKKKRRMKRKQRDEEDSVVQDDFKMEVKDTRFDAVYTSHLFNIDPSAPEFKKTKGMEDIINEKGKRRSKKKESRRDHETLDVPGHEASKRSPCGGAETTASDSRSSLQTLVKSVKSKTMLHKKSVSKHKT